MREMKREDLALRLVGGVAIAMGVLGICYNLVGLPALLVHWDNDPETPYFLPAFVIMSSICIACYALLIVSGIQFLRGRSALARLFADVLIFEVIYFLTIGMLWLIPVVGMSIGAATGVANGGLMIQAFILFPLWAPFVVKWAKKKQEESSTEPCKVCGEGTR
jgi:hypothetical protein